MFTAALFDIGDVLTLPIWYSFDLFEQRTGRAMPWRGILDPDNDPLWQRHLAGDLDYQEYWQAMSDAAGFPDWRSLFREMGYVVPEKSFDPEMVALMAEIKAAGLKVGVLTNDGAAITGQAWFEAQPDMVYVDVFADARQFGGGKPAPEAYLGAAAMLDVTPGDVVFLDDLPMCVDGALAVGMTAILVDPLDKAPAIAATRAFLGLASATGGNVAGTRGAAGRDG